MVEEGRHKHQHSKISLKNKKRREMTYYGRNNYGWNPSSEHQVNQSAEEHRRFDGNRHHRPKGKGHVAFKMEHQEVDSRERMAMAETELAPEGINRSANQTVDDEADAFIQEQHKRFELSKLMSMRRAA